MNDIFLSYNREDQVQAKRFADGLGAQGYEVWWDVGLKAGEAYDEVTEAALRGAKVVVVLWSPQSVKSRWVRAEALLAQRLGTLTPVMIAPCERPIMFELTQTTDMSNWKGGYTDPQWLSFLSDVRARINRPSATDAPHETRSLSALISSAPKKPIGRRTLLLVGGGAIGILAVGAAIWRFSARDSATTNQSARSIAILPFENISGDPSQNYFADGLSAEVRAELARNNLLQVAAQMSSAAMQEMKEGAVAMAKKLGVAFLLEGNVRKGSDFIRVNAELIDGKTGFSKWSQTFDRPLDNVFQVQSEIASAVAMALAVQISASNGSKKGQTGTEKSVGGTLDVVAYEHFLRGRELFESALSLETDQQALAQFDAAIAADKDYAGAHAARGRTLAVLANQSSNTSQMAQFQDQALDAAKEAVRLAPNYAAGQSALGLAYFQMRLDAKAARGPFEQSMQHGGGDSDVLTGYAMFSARIGNHQAATTSIERALSLDPLNPTVFRSAGQIEAAAHRYGRAIELYDQALVMNPKMTTAHFLKGEALYFLGKLDEAGLAFAAEPSAIFQQTGQAIHAFKIGKKQDGQDRLKKLMEEFGDAAAYQQAQILAQAGEINRALDAISRAKKIGDSGLVLARNDQMLDPIRREPLFLDLLKSIGFD